jgi:cobalt-zinc-cadmium efflux system outer membrane protein
VKGSADMIRQWGAIGLAAGLLARGIAVTAQGGPADLPKTVTLEQVLKLLEERSPRTIAERAAVAVAAADRITARTLPNPTVSYGGSHLVSGLSTGAVTQHQVLVEQPLLLFHQRQARLDAAEANVRAEEARVAESLAQRRLLARQTFATLLSRQEQLRIQQEGLADLERVANLVRGRAAAGDRSQYEVLRIDTETASLRVQTMNAATDVEDVSGQLAALLGLPDWSPRAAGNLDAGDTPTDVEVLWKTAELRRPALVTLREQQAAARGGLFLARRERLPVPAISGGTQTTREVNGVSALVGFSLPLPLFDHNQGAIAKAAAQISAADLLTQAGVGEVHAEIERAATVFQKRKDALRAFDGAVGDRVPTLRRMAEDAYREGSADILELLDANRSLRDFQLTRVQQLEAVKLAEEGVIGAAGLDAGDARPQGRPD